MTIDTRGITTPHAAVKAQALAKRKRAYADDLAGRDPTGARWERIEAAALAEKAAIALDPRNSVRDPLTVGNGGELIVTTEQNLAEKPGIIDTVREHPDMLTAEASVRRLDLAAEAGAMTLAVDTAETIQATNSLEKMLAHQIAVAHANAMHFMAEAREELAAYRRSGSQYPHRSVEAARFASTAARLMDVSQRAMLTLDRLRNGGKQVVTVQHVTVADGGKAIVASQVQPGGADQ